MLAAAREGNWQEFDRLKGCTSSAIDEVRALTATVSLSVEERRIKLAAMQKILANDGRIQELAEPWLKRVTRWLPGSPTPIARTNGIPR